MNLFQTKNEQSKFHLFKVKVFSALAVVTLCFLFSHAATAKTATQTPKVVNPAVGSAVVSGAKAGAAAGAKGSDKVGMQTFLLDSKKSTLEWGGSKIVGTAHKGTITMKDGSVEFMNDLPIKAEVTVLMNTIKDTDIKDAKNNKKLVDHLNSDDFFSTEKFPTAQISIKSFEPTQENQYLLKGDLTIKGVTKPIQAKASITESTQGKKVILADMEFDRTDYDVRYGSGKFFENLGDKMISDKVQLKASILLNLKK